MASGSPEFLFDVFLSHSSKDKEVVRDIATRLKNDGIRVWFDEWEIGPGDSIPHKIEEGLENSRLLILCLSKEAYDSDWAKLESQTFRFKDPLNQRRGLVPLKLDDQPTKGTLAQFLHIDWRLKSRESEYTKLLEVCQTVETGSIPRTDPSDQNPRTTKGVSESPVGQSQSGSISPGRWGALKIAISLLVIGVIAAIGVHAGATNWNWKWFGDDTPPVENLPTVEPDHVTTEEAISARIEVRIQLIARNPEGFEAFMRLAKILERLGNTDCELDRQSFKRRAVDYPPWGSSEPWDEIIMSLLGIVDEELSKSSAGGVNYWNCSEFALALSKGIDQAARSTFDNTPRLNRSEELVAESTGKILRAADEGLILKSPTGDESVVDGPGMEEEPLETIVALINVIDQVDEATTDTITMAGYNALFTQTFSEALDGREREWLTIYEDDLAKMIRRGWENGVVRILQLVEEKSQGDVSIARELMRTAVRQRLESEPLYVISILSARPQNRFDYKP